MTQPAKFPRRKKGFEHTSSLLNGRIRKASETRGFSETRILTHWAEIVGPETAAIALPVEVSYSRGGLGATLTVLTTGAQAPMLDMQKEQLREKINAVYGYNAIARIRLTQTAATGFSEGRIAFTPAPKRKKQPDAQICARASQETAQISDATLREALENLARNVLMRQEQNKGPENP